MKEMTNKRILNIFTICIIVFIPLFLNISFYLQVHNIVNNYDSINPSMVIWFSIPFLLYVYLKDMIDSKRKLDIYDYMFFFLVITGILVSFFSINIKISLLGSNYRHEGFLSLLGYYLLFINWKINGTKEDIKKYIKIFIIIGIVNSIYAFLQIYTFSKIVLRYAIDRNMASGLCGNPNFFGSLIVILLGILSSKFLMEEKIKTRDLVLLFLFLVSLINSNSTGPILTYILTMFFVIAILNIKKILNKENIIVLILMIIFSFSFSFSLTKFVNRLRTVDSNNIRCELCDIKKTINTGGNGRLDIWTNTLEIIRKHPVVGVGYDNLGLAYPNKREKTYFYITNNHVEKKVVSGSIYVDNAHNVYLHTIVTSGIIGSIPLFLLLLYTFINASKSKNKYIIILLCGFVAYSVQAFANISVIQVAPIYYIIIGLILSEKENKAKLLT